MTDKKKVNPVGLWIAGAGSLALLAGVALTQGIAQAVGLGGLGAIVVGAIVWSRGQ